MPDPPPPPPTNTTPSLPPSSSSAAHELPVHMLATTSTRKPPLPVTVNRATPADAASIAVMGARSFLATFGWMRPQAVMDEFISKNYSEAALTRTINRDIVFFAKESNTGKVVGFVQLVPGATDPCLPDPEKDNVSLIRLSRIYVDVDAAGSGVGQALWERALEWSHGWFEGVDREKGESGRRRAMWLGVWENHPRAQRLYKRWGFEKIGEMEFEVGGEVDTDWIMIKWVS